MLERTNMDAIRALAKSFLDMKVEYKCGIAKHPFNVIGEEGTPVFEQWKSDVLRAIDSIKDVDMIMFMIRPSWHMMFLHQARPYLSKKDFAECFADAFIEGENPTLGSGLSVDDLVDMFKVCGQARLMEKEDKKVYKALPNTVAIYRGILVDDEKHLMSLSWTLLPAVAEVFASRLTGQGKIYTAIVEKKNILAYFGGRGEAEVIVDPKSLKSITLYKDLSV